MLAAISFFLNDESFEAKQKLAEQAVEIQTMKKLVSQLVRRVQTLEDEQSAENTHEGTNAEINLTLRRSLSQTNFSRISAPPGPLSDDTNILKNHSPRLDIVFLW